MNRSHWYSLGGAILILALVALVWHAGASLWVTPGALALQDSQDIPSLISASGQAIDSANDVITFLTSILIGFFILLGFSFQRRGSTNPFDVGDYVAVVIFVILAFSSFYFAYICQMQSARYLPRLFLDSSAFLAAQHALLLNISWHALLTALTAVPVAYLIVRSMYSPHQAQADQAGPAPSTENPDCAYMGHEQGYRPSATDAREH
jgi:hypothetical protein